MELGLKREKLTNFPPLFEIGLLFPGDLRKYKEIQEFHLILAIIRLCVRSKPPIIGFTFTLPASVAGPEAVCKRARLQDKPKSPATGNGWRGFFIAIDCKLVIANFKFQIEQ